MIAMSRGSIAVEWTLFVVFFILQCFIQLTFTQDDILWCNQQQEHSRHEVNGQNISLRFSLKEKISNTQSIVWTRAELVCERLQNRTFECITNASLDNSRYTLSQINATQFEMTIAFTEQNDSGQHVVNIYQESQSLCTVVILNLTIEGTAPICSTLFNRHSGKLQMTCQWLQVNKGDRAQLVAGNQVLYEYETLRINYKGYLSNKLIAYVSLENIFNEEIMPSGCDISNDIGIRNGTCSFPPVKQHTIRDDVLQIQYVTFNCCAPNENFSLTWWYNNSCDLQPVNSTEPYTMTADRFGNIVFLCGEEDDSSNLIVHSIGQLNLPDHQYRVSFLSVHDSDLKQPNDSTDELRCETLIVNITKTEPTSPTDDSVTQENDPSSNCVVNEETNVTHVVSQMKTISMETMLLTVLALSTIAHCVSIIAFVFSYRNADEYDVRKRD